MSTSVKKALERLFAAPFSLGSACAGFLMLVIVRMTIENALFFYPPRSASFVFFEFTHLLLLSILTFLLLVPVVRLALRLDFRQAAHLMVLGFAVMPVPPILDRLIMGDTPYWSFYKFDGLKGLGWRFLTFFGDRPDIGITYGPRIISALVILFLTTLSLVLTRKLWRALVAGLGSYAVLFLVGTFPSWLTLAVRSFSKSPYDISQIDVATLFLSPITSFDLPAASPALSLNIKMSLCLAPIVLAAAAFTLLKARPKVFRALLLNARFPQIAYHLGLLAIGMLLAFNYARPVVLVDVFSILAPFVLGAAVVFAWLASVVANDIYDTSIDRLTNARRPLVSRNIEPAEFRTWGILFFFFSLLLAGLVSFQALFLLLGYQAAAWIYSVPPFRLKRIPFLATLVASLAGIIVLMAGYVTVSPEHDLRSLPLQILFFLFIAYTFVIPIKDFKDISGDKADGVYTVPVVFGEYWGKIIVGSGIFVSYAVSVLILHEPRLFWWAVLFGSLSFWILLSSRDSETDWFRYRYLPGWILGCTALYGLVLVWTIL
jgi:4-hydroxybenzoate polyprenyltransferase